MEMPRILFVDDEQCLRGTYGLLMKEAYGENRAFEIEFHDSPANAIASLKRNPFNVALVFLDQHFSMGQENMILGSDYIREIKKINSYIELIMMSADESPETMSKWIKNGADKFVYKDSRNLGGKLQVLINQALTNFHAKFGKLMGTTKNAILNMSEPVKKLGLVSISPQMETIANLVLQCAKSDLAALLIGETGTGKELIAKAIHNNSTRADEAFVAIDCTHYKNSLLIQSELFGSEKGAFTGAENKEGLLKVADGGTVFLDEIHHLSMDAQAMLLRAIQERTIRKVGGKSEIKIDVRFIFAGKPILKEMVQNNDFLPDLYYRMKEVRIEIPNLHSREGDIDVLTQYFMDRENQKSGNLKRIHPDTLSLFHEYKWPGNVRELENLIKRLSVMISESVILPEHVLKHGELEIDLEKLNIQEIQTFEDLEREQKKETIKLLMRAYELSNSNGTEAARLLNMPRMSFVNKCKSLGIQELMDGSIARERENKSGLKSAIKKSWSVVTASLSEKYE